MTIIVSSYSLDFYFLRAVVSPATYRLPVYNLYRYLYIIPTYIIRFGWRLWRTTYHHICWKQHNVTIRYTPHYDDNNNITDGRRPVGTPAAADERIREYHRIYTTYIIIYIIRKQRNYMTRLMQCPIEIIETIVYSHKLVRSGHLRGIWRRKQNKLLYYYI